MDATTQMMKELTEANGVSGFEQEVRAKMEKYLQPLSQELLHDRLGSVVGKKVGDANGPRILVAGHLDEVGFMVTQITDKGFLRFEAVGGWWAHSVLGHRVTIASRQGKYLGVIGAKAPHVLTAEERTKVLPLKEMFIDVGARSREEVAEMGIRVGDPIIPVSEFFTMRKGELWGGKALDNRAGCAVAIEVLKQLQGKAHPNVVYSGATVQEEVGLRGAETVANLVQPDIAFAIDVGVADDTPGFESAPSTCCNLGEGPLLTLMDRSLIPHTGFRNWVIDVAEEVSIPLQYEVMIGGGTDGGKFHLTGIGCPTVVIGFATRYIHSHNAIMSKSDFEQAVTLVVALIQRMDQAKWSQIMSS
jgi:putative aminopeptidase FrvX